VTVRRSRVSDRASDGQRHHATTSRLKARRPLWTLTPDAAARERRVQGTITAGALGGGALLAGFGLVPALIGAGVGGALAYLFERSVDRNRASYTP
jgi:hypothetical protein